MRLTKLAIIAGTCVLLFNFVMPTYAQGKAKGQEKKAVVGNVEQINSTSVTVEDKKNKKSTTTIDSTTKVIGQDKKNVLLKSLKKNDKIAIISTDSAIATDGAKGKKALKIFVKEASSSAQSKRHGIQGIISGINGSIITIVHQVHQERTFDLGIDANTIVTMKGANATIADLKLGMRVAAVGETDASSSGMLIAKRIHVIPGKGQAGLPKTATPSATLSITPTISSTPSATPTITPTP
jgi:hypothetical protein